MLFSGSQYEDIEAIARISAGDQALESMFDTYFKEVLEDFNLVSGKILSQADRTKLYIERRPDFEWNLFIPLLLPIASKFKNSVPGLDCFGITQDDHRSSELQSKLLDWSLYQCNDINYELAKAFLYALIGKISWLYTDYAFGHPLYPEGKVIVQHYDQLRIKFDPNWTRRDMSDCNFLDNSGYYSPEELVNIYARNNKQLEDEIMQKATQILGESTIERGRLKKLITTWAERVFNFGSIYSGGKGAYDDYDRLAMNNNYFIHRGRFKAVDWYERRNVAQMTFFDPTTRQDVDITDDVRREGLSKSYVGRDWYDRDKLYMIRESYNQPIIKESRPVKIWQTSVIPALNVKAFDGLQNIQNGNFKFLSVLAYDFHPDILQTKSMIDHVKDSVKSANLRRNTMLTYLMRVAHGGWIGEQSYIKDFVNDFYNNEIGGIKTVADNAISQKRVIQIQPPALPAGLNAFMMEDIEAGKQLSGSGDASRGIKETSGESGKLVQQRISMQEQMQEWINENAQSSLLYVGYNLIALHQRYLKYPRLLMLFSDHTDPTWLQLNQRSANQVMNDPTLGTYILRISKKPFGTLAKELEYKKLIDIYEIYMKLGRADYIDPSLIAELSGIKSYPRIINRIKTADKMAGIILNEQQQLAEIMQELQIQKSQNELESQALANMNTYNEMALDEQLSEQYNI